MPLVYPNVRKYDGSWIEWGNLMRTPIREALRRRPNTAEAGNAVEDAVLAQDLPFSRFECGRCMDGIPRTHREGPIEVRRAAQHRQIDPEPCELRERQQARAF